MALSLLGITGKRVLGTRDSARVVVREIAKMPLDDLVLDFSTVAVVTPSFADELLADLVRRITSGALHGVTITNYPADLPEKLESLLPARSGVQIHESNVGLELVILPSPTAA